MVKTINDDLRQLCYDLSIPIPAFFYDMDALFFDKFIYEHNLLGKDMIYDISVRIDFSDLKTICEYYGSHRTELSDLYVSVLRNLNNMKSECFADVYFEYDVVNFSNNLPGLLLTSQYSAQKLDYLCKSSDYQIISSFSETIDSHRNRQIRKEALSLFLINEQKIQRDYNELLGYLDKQAVLYQVGIMPRKDLSLKIYYRFFPFENIGNCLELDICKPLRNSWEMFESLVDPISMPMHAVIDFRVDLSGKKDLPMLGISFLIQDMEPLFERIRNVYPTSQVSSEYWNQINTRWQSRSIKSTSAGVILQIRSVSHVKASLFPDRVDWKIYYDDSLFSPQLHRSIILLH